LETQQWVIVLVHVIVQRNSSTKGKLLPLIPRSIFLHLLKMLGLQVNIIRMLKFSYDSDKG